MNHTEEWRLVVRLKSRRALREYLEFHRWSGRELARRADEIARKQHKATVGPAIVGHLLSGKRNSCNLITATAIEEALQCPPGFLFEPKMSHVADGSRRREKVPA